MNEWEGSKHMFLNVMELFTGDERGFTCLTLTEGLGHEARKIITHCFPALSVMSTATSRCLLFNKKSSEASISIILRGQLKTIWCQFLCFNFFLLGSLLLLPFVGRVRWSPFPTSISSTSSFRFLLLSFWQVISTFLTHFLRLYRARNAWLF